MEASLTSLTPLIVGFPLPCYEQGTQPQKQSVLHWLLDSVLGCLLEFKQELVDLQLSEYHYADHVLQEFSLSSVSGQWAGGWGCSQVEATALPWPGSQKHPPPSKHSALPTSKKLLAMGLPLNIEKI